MTKVVLLVGVLVFATVLPAAGPVGLLSFTGTINVRGLNVSSPTLAKLPVFTNDVIKTAGTPVSIKLNSGPVVPVAANVLGKVTPTGFTITASPAPPPIPTVAAPQVAGQKPPPSISHYRRGRYQ